MNSGVRVRREPIVFPTYEPAAPDLNPMFLEKRVYQGSSGRVYPLPFIDRVAETPTDRAWDSVTIENEYVSLTMLPEIGGRIHIGQDLTNGYDFFYRQQVIKPALVGLAGPWASGGVEFNWPQHHRPSTFMATDVSIEHGEDGSITVWLSEHEPMNRMKGMHGICLHPGRSVVELKVRLYNRTPYVQTFLWWTNIATHVHQAYKSFFPPDVHTVADHAKRATSFYPLCEDHYYGVDYGSRGRDGVPEDEIPSHFIPASAGGDGPSYAPNDLSWYANIPVPTSYMCLGTKEDFVGGYDGFAKAGLMHVADHHIAPGKKQWTWGNQEFGYSWDRNLTDEDGPYIELMAGVYTDNQPDFSFIGVGETKVFSQFWYPYQAIGVAHYANIDAAISLTPAGIGTTCGVAVTRVMEQATISAFQNGISVQEWTVDLAPDKPFLETVEVSGTLLLILSDRDGSEVARYENREPERGEPVKPATEPALPEDVSSSDELYLIGLHLDQYRHATRNPALYWREALRRDAGDMRCNNAMGFWHFKRGEFDEAIGHFQAAIARSIERNPNPYDGEPYYNLGLSLRMKRRFDDAYDAFAKSAWSSAWQGAAYHAMGELDCMRGNWQLALHNLNKALRKDADNFRAKDLRAVVLKRLGRDSEAEASLRKTLATDPLDFWAKHLLGEKIECDNGVRFDLAIDCTRAGLNREALEILAEGDQNATDGTVPMLFYYEAYIRWLMNEDPREAFAKAEAASPDYCFPARLEDLLVLEKAVAGRQEDARARYFLGNLLYDRRRHREAIALWQESAILEPSNSIVLRNIGIGSFNVLGNPKAALNAYDAAGEATPNDGRVRFERDQLWKRVGIAPEVRLAELRKRMDLVSRRDDLTIEFCVLLNNLGLPEEADEILSNRKFQPWEGGEGQALGVFSRTKLALAHKALADADAEAARKHLHLALNPPHNLGEARHLLANASDLWLAMGDALSGLGDKEAAQKYWKKAAEFKGDFQEMSVKLYSELTYFQALALRRLGRDEDANRMLENLAAYAVELAKSEAKIDYFATSLPTMLLFDDDLQKRQENTARFISAQAELGRGHIEGSKLLLDQVLIEDPNHAMAMEFRAHLVENTPLVGVQG